MADVTMPSKGNLITIEDKSYRVMKIDGTTALLMANYSIGTMAMYSSSVTTTSFGSITGAKYEGSDIDTHLNTTYYNSLSIALKSAIIPTNIKQSMYNVKWGTDYTNLKMTTYDGTVYSAGKVAEIDISSPRNIFVLDLDDIAEYYSGISTITSSMLGELLLADKNDTWLRSSTDMTNYFRIFSGNYAESIYGPCLVYGAGGTKTIVNVVPAFYIDLSKIEYKKIVSMTSSSTAEVTSDTSLTSSVNCNVGDLVVAAIATRDTLTLSDGWTLVSISGINSADTTNGQRLSWAYKFAESTSETITVTQASAQRLYINMISLYGATGVTDNGYTYQNTESNTITVTKSEGLTLWALTAPKWDTSTTHSLWTSSPSLNIIQLGTDTQPRLGIALDSSDGSEITFTPGIASSTLIAGSLTILETSPLVLSKFYRDNLPIQIGSGLYQFRRFSKMMPTYPITVSATNCTETNGVRAIDQRNGLATLKFELADGYGFPNEVNVTGAGSSWNSLTGELELSNASGAVTVEVACAAIPKLATPQNLSVDGTTVTWNEVENATSYDIYVDGELSWTVSENLQEETTVIVNDVQALQMDNRVILE